MMGQLLSDDLDGVGNGEDGAILGKAGETTPGTGPLGPRTAIAFIPAEREWTYSADRTVNVRALVLRLLAIPQWYASSL